MKKITRPFTFTSKKRTYGMVVLFAVLFSLTSLQAQSIFSIVGNGTTSNPSTTYPAPFGNWYYGSRHQLYVSPAELIASGISGGANITSIGFNITSVNSAVPHQNWAITVYTTSAANPIGTAYLNTGAISSSTPVTVTGTIGWYQTPVAPFVWDGVSGLVIQTCFVNPTGYTQNYSTQWTTNLTNSDVKSRFEYQDLISVCPTAGFANTSTTTRPDIRFEWNFLTPCNGVPTANSIVTPTFQICSNVPYGGIGFASTYTLGGLTYQWFQSTTSSVGPYTPVPSGGTGWSYSVPGLTTTTFYQAVVTCTNTNSSYTTAGAPIQVAATTVSNIPYHEGFEGIGQTDRLPNCSWWAPNQGTTVKTYTTVASGNRVPRTGTSFAAYQLPSTNNAMYTNGLNLVAGITYSASAFFATEYFGYNNWTNLSLLIGPNQNATGLVQVAATSPAISGPYRNLGGTFTVPSNGVYYLAIRASGSNGNALYLMIDDISVTIPCTPASGNAPVVSLSAGNTTVCSGDQVTLNASGADAFQWSNGASGSGVVITPMQSGVYSVVGTNTLTGCTNTQSVAITVNQSPSVFALANKTEVCPGESAYITAYGAASYVWSNSGSGALIQVSPTSNTTYSVIGTSTNGCSSTGTVAITVKPQPIVSVSANNNNNICAGEFVTLTAMGAASYQWNSSTSPLLLNNNPLTLPLTSTTTFTVYGTGANGCINSTTISKNVEACTSITENANSIGGLSVFPNPTSGIFTIELKSGVINAVELIDIAGRVVLTANSDTNTVNINMSELASGVYYARVSTQFENTVVRVIKN